MQNLEDTTELLKGLHKSIESYRSSKREINGSEDSPEFRLIRTKALSTMNFSISEMRNYLKRAKELGIPYNPMISQASNVTGYNYHATE